MIWVSWRLQRTETLIAGIILALITALLVPTGLSMASAYHHDGLAACIGRDAPQNPCGAAIDSFQSRFQSLFNMLDWFTLIPGLIGVLLAAPFILDLENGTYRLAWTQSITRRRWIATKLAVPITVALLIAGVLILLNTWWRTPFVHLNGRMNNGTYDSEGTVVLGYTLFALGLALALGVIWRRTVAAVTIAFVGYFVCHIFVDTWLRDRLVTPLHTTWKSLQGQPASLFHARILSEGGSGPAVSVANGGPAGYGGPKGFMPTTIHTVYQPASHFWALQGVETAMFGGVALLLICVAAWWTHDHVA